MLNSLSKKHIAAACSLFFYLIIPLLASAQVFTDFRSVVFYTVLLLNQVIKVVIGIGVLVFIYGVLKYVGAGDDAEKVKQGRNFIIYGIVGIFVMLSVWGLVFIITNTFFRFGFLNTSPPTPRNIPIP